MEKEFIDWLTDRQPNTRPPVELGIGDDAAVFQCQQPMVISTDTLADGVHFDLSEHCLSSVGHKTIAVNLSDMAAMGAQPIAATVNLFLPHDFDLAKAQELYLGIETTAQKYNVQIIGGDTNRWDGNLVVGATTLGTAYEDAKNSFWRMDSAEASDVVLVTGALGGSILGKHMDFEPRIHFAERLIKTYEIHAATDITDSLTIDLAAIARKSKCGFILDEHKIRISNQAFECQESDGKSGLEHALNDGEDFELILCVSPKTANEIVSDPFFGDSIYAIGRLNSTGQYSIRSANNPDPRKLEIKGYEH